MNNEARSAQEPDWAYSRPADPPIHLAGPAGQPTPQHRIPATGPTGHADDTTSAPSTSSPASPAQSGEHHRSITAPGRDRQDLITALTDLLTAGATLRRSELASWAIAQRETDLQQHICAIVQQLTDWDDQHDTDRQEHTPIGPAAAPW